MRIHRGLLALLLAAVMVVTAGCDMLPWGQNAPPDKITEILTAEDMEALAETCVQYGEYFSENMMDESTAFWYGYGASTLGALRLCAERMLWLRGEGKNFAELSEGSRYVTWEELRRLSASCPYPYYFEGLIYDVQGKAEEAKGRYTCAAALPDYPEGGLDFHFLRDMPIAELYTLRDKLRELEDALYSKYEPQFSLLPDNVTSGRPDYLISAIIALSDEEKFDEAENYARELVRIAPLDANNWIAAIITAVNADDGAQIMAWLYEAEAYHPDDETLNAMLAELKNR